MVARFHKGDQLTDLSNFIIFEPEEEEQLSKWKKFASDHLCIRNVLDAYDLPENEHVIGFTYDDNEFEQILAIIKNETTGEEHKLKEELIPIVSKSFYGYFFTMDDRICSIEQTFSEEWGKDKQQTEYIFTEAELLDIRDKYIAEENREEFTTQVINNFKEGSTYISIEQ